MQVTTNPDQKLYVLHHGDHVTCFGFENANKHANHIANKLKRGDLQFTADDFGTLAGYDKYKAAVSAWAQSAQSKKTYFEPNTPPAVIKVLETYREEQNPIRLFLGDAQTGQDWYEENDVVGYIGRSTGMMKVPLLVEPGEHGGCAILCASIVKIMDVVSEAVLWEHPTYINSMAMRQTQQPSDDGYQYEAFNSKGVHARFRSVGEAHDYVRFITGETAAKPEQLRRILSNCCAWSR
jgi:hypothetical protein